MWKKRNSPQIGDRAEAAIGPFRIRHRSKERIMADEDRDYFYRRAEQEIACAQSACGERQVRLHYQLAETYLDRVFGADGDPRSVSIPG